MSVSVPRRNQVLIVEDKPSLASVYRAHLEKDGFACELAAGQPAAAAHLENSHVDAIVLSLELDGPDCISLIEKWSAGNPSASIIVIAANASINDAVDAVRAGAWDYLVKPVSRNRLITTLANACRSPAQQDATRPAGPSLPVTSAPDTMIGSSRAMADTRSQIEAIASSSAPAFITGESGTGKELCAQAIHDFSPRADQPFIALNCGAIPHDLMESEIFGHLKGAFTGAISDREGAAAAADGGTLFLDEICEMELSLQIKLLRFLQTGTIQPVGSTHTRKVDIRIICATNRTPQKEVAEGRFREDLYFRLHVLPVQLKPLRERDRDVAELASCFLDTYTREEARSFSRIDNDAVDTLLAYHWPGNIRELQNVIRQSVVLHDGEALETHMLPDHITNAKPACSSPVTGQNGRLLWQIERDVIEAAISGFAGSIPKAADALGISPSTIYRKRETWAEKSA
ncbi:sigma 54-interacting transcriptional regulator [Anderseniella sp. Alg231-50]|uniref:sigma 54-interacting transcriptional regulator n=1 Tax=Anderseniella sp. Alg231-50 TaxID=1922226 RepID=UPI000D556EC2